MNTLEELGFGRVFPFLPHWFIVSKCGSLTSTTLEYEMKVSVGEDVERGEVVALSGSTGDYTFEPHLHFSVKIGDSSIDPKRFIEIIKSLLE